MLEKDQMASISLKKYANKLKDELFLSQKEFFTAKDFESCKELLKNISF